MDRGESLKTFGWLRTKPRATLDAGAALGPVKKPFRRPTMRGVPVRGSIEIAPCRPSWCPSRTTAMLGLAARRAARRRSTMPKLPDVRTSRNALVASPPVCGFAVAPPAAADCTAPLKDTTPISIARTRTRRPATDRATPPVELTVTSPSSSDCPREYPSTRRGGASGASDSGDDAAHAEKRRTEAAPRPEAGGKEVRDAPVHDHGGVALLAGPGVCRLHERETGAGAADGGDRRRPGEVAMSRRPREADDRLGLLDRHEQKAAGDRTIRLEDEARPVPTPDLVLDVGSQLVHVQSIDAPRKRRRVVLHLLHERRHRKEGVDVPQLRMADAGRPPRLGVDLADGVGLLLAEREPKPGIDEPLIGGGNEREVASPSGIEPGPRKSGVEVAHILRVGRGMAGVLDPGVRPPDRVVSRPAYEIANDAAVAHSDGAVRILGAPQLLDLAAGGVRRFIRRRQKRLGRTMAAVPLGEEHRRGGQVLLFERPNLDPHSGSIPFQAGTWTVRAPGVPPRLTLRRRTSFAAEVSWIAPSGFARTST